MLTYEYIRLVEKQTAYFFPFDEGSNHADALINLRTTKDEWEKRLDENEIEQKDSLWLVIEHQRGALLRAIFHYEQIKVANEIQKEVEET